MPKNVDVREQEIIIWHSRRGKRGVTMISRINERPKDVRFLYRRKRIANCALFTLHVTTVASCVMQNVCIFFHDRFENVMISRCFLQNARNASSNETTKVDLTRDPGSITNIQRNKILFVRRRRRRRLLF